MQHLQKTRGGAPYFARSNPPTIFSPPDVQTFRRSDVQTLFQSIPFPLMRLRTLFLRENYQTFSFQQLPHSFHHYGGYTPPQPSNLPAIPPTLPSDGAALALLSLFAERVLHNSFPIRRFRTLSQNCRVPPRNSHSGTRRPSSQKKKSGGRKFRLAPPHFDFVGLDCYRGLTSRGLSSRPWPAFPRSSPGPWHPHRASACGETS
jgi:hypothetical protein